MSVKQQIQPLTPPLTDSPPYSPRISPTKRDPRKRIYTVLMRAGTSKGLFFRKEDLPRNRDEWSGIIRTAMGSPDTNSKQLNGMGGGVSTQSKVAVVGVSDDPRADVEYTFIQVPVDDRPLDFSGNCGNMSSGVGPFAVDEGIVTVDRMDLHQTTIRIRNTNTNAIIHTTFSVENGYVVETGDLALDGVSGTGSPIRLDFLRPGGCMTGRLLPTGNPVDEISLDARVYNVSLVDAANPFVFVSRDELGLVGDETIEEIMMMCGPTLMEIRARGAVLMNLADSVEQARAVMGTPKIAIVGPPVAYSTSGGRCVYASEYQVWSRPFSMGKPHPAIQMTGAVCFAAAAAIPGTLVQLAVGHQRVNNSPLIIGHAAGTMATDSEAIVDIIGNVEIVRGSVYRTARRLMEGSVLY